MNYHFLIVVAYYFFNINKKYNEMPIYRITKKEKSYRQSNAEVSVRKCMQIKRNEYFIEWFPPFLHSFMIWNSEINWYIKIQLQIMSESNQCHQLTVWKESCNQSDFMWNQCFGDLRSSKTAIARVLEALILLRSKVFTPPQ